MVTRKHYKLIIKKFRDVFLCIISTSIDDNHVKYARQNLNVSHYCYVCNCKYTKKCSTEFVGMLVMFHTTFYMSRSNGTFVLTRNTKLHIGFEWLPCCFPFYPQLSSYTVLSTGSKLLRGAHRYDDTINLPFCIK